MWRHRRPGLIAQSLSPQSALDVLLGMDPSRRPICLTFMASHVASSSKLEALSVCLQSIVSQTWAERHGPQALGLLISWSAASEVLARRVRALLCELVPGQVVVEQSQPHSQFEHYRQLAVLVATQRDKLAESPDVATHNSRNHVWVGFTDDDDCWHPRRLETFCAAVAEAEAGAMAWATDEATIITQLRFPWFAARRNDDDDDGTTAAAGSAEGSRHYPTAVDAATVDAMLRRGDAQLCRSGSDSSSSSVSEHWTAISRFELVGGFFAAAPAGLLNSPFADLAWERYSAKYSEDAAGRPAVSGGASVSVPWSENQPWMYFYNRPPWGSNAYVQLCRGGSASQHMSSSDWAPTPDEWLVAARFYADLPIDRAAKPAADGESRVAHKLAHLRRECDDSTCAFPTRAPFLPPLCSRSLNLATRVQDLLLPPHLLLLLYAVEGRGTRLLLPVRFPRRQLERHVCAEAVAAAPARERSANARDADQRPREDVEDPPGGHAT